MIGRRHRDPTILRVRGTQALITGRDVTITGRIGPCRIFSATVRYGTGDLELLCAQVNITANSPPAGHRSPDGPATSHLLMLHRLTLHSRCLRSRCGDCDLQRDRDSGLQAQYYNDSSSAAYPLSDPFAGSPVLTGIDATVDFDWDDDSPASGESDFSRRDGLVRVRAPVSGSYTFTVTGDDGVRPSSTAPA
jgi:hypothetical protein